MVLYGLYGIELGEKFILVSRGEKVDPSPLALAPTVFLWFNVPPQFIVPPSLGAGACAPLRCTPPLGGLVVP